MLALIAEGAAEQAILEVLLTHHALQFEIDDLLEERVLRTRKAQAFAERHLNKGLDEQVTIYRILDSREEKFHLSEPYRAQVNQIINVYTRPEIEILHIINHGDFAHWNRHFRKPSAYVKANYHDLGNIKSFAENKQFWEAHFPALIQALKVYKHAHVKEFSIADLLNSNFR